MPRARELLFRIFYSTSYTLVFCVLLGFICASPADSLYQSWRRQRVIDIAFIAGTYVVTGLVALLIYASRIYTNRAVLGAIPKTYMPIDENELPKKRVWQYLSDVRLRSAIIAYQARPRSKRIELETLGAEDRIAVALQPEYKKEPDVSAMEPQWGPIQHPGWSSPVDPDFPNLEYSVVLAELKHLIEAKAIGLAPVDSTLAASDDMDAAVVEVLARPDDMVMRGYLARLVGLGIIPDNSIVSTFLGQYEHAVYSGQPMTKDEFQSLMRLFAEILRTMTPFNLATFDLDSGSKSNLAKHGFLLPTLSQQAAVERSRFRSSLSSMKSVSRSKNTNRRRVSEDSVPSQTTDELAGVHDRAARRDVSYASPSSISARQPRAGTDRNTRTTEATESAQPPLQRRRSQVSVLSTRSSTSGKSGKSGRSSWSNTGSVIIRLNPRHDHTMNGVDNSGNETLPYTFELPPPSSERI